MQALIAMVGGPHPHRDRNPHHRRRSVVRQPVHQHGFGPGVQRRQRAGGFRRGSLLLHGGNGLQHQAERRQRAADRQDRHQIGQGRAGERQVRAGGGRGDEGNRQQDLHHRRDCPADEPAGPECGHRGGARRRARQRLRRGGGGGPQAGGAQPEGGRRDQPALGHDRESVGEGRRDARQAGARHPEDRGTGAGDHRGQQGTGHRLRADQQGAAATREGHSAECLRRRRDGFHHRGTDRPVRPAHERARILPHGRCRAGAGRPVRERQACRIVDQASGGGRPTAPPRRLEEDLRNPESLSR